MVGLAVLREGSEIVLFLYGIVATGTTAVVAAAGGALGSQPARRFTALTYYGLLAIPPRHIFSVTTVLIALLAAGMAAQAVQFLDAAGTDRRARQADVGQFRPAAAGQHLRPLLHTLIGYNDRPTELQLIAYLATLAVMAILTRIAAPPRPARAPPDQSIFRKSGHRFSARKCDHSKRS